MLDNSQPVELRGTQQVCKQLDCSPVTLWRRVRDPRLNFPQPITISRRNYYRGHEIDAWIEEQAEAA